MASSLALWSFFGLFTGVAKLAIVAVTLAFVGWRAGWWNRLGLARRLLSWSRLPESGRAGASTSGHHGPAATMVERLRHRLNWRMVVFLVLLAWVAAWVLVQRLMISVPDDPRPPIAPVSSSSTTPSLSRPAS